MENMEVLESTDILLDINNGLGDLIVMVDKAIVLIIVLAIILASYFIYRFVKSFM